MAAGQMIRHRRIERALIMSREETQKKERSNCDRKKSGFPSKPGAETEPKQKDIVEYDPQYFGAGCCLLCVHGARYGVSGKQHPARQPAAHGPAVSQNSGGQYPLDKERIFSGYCGTGAAGRIAEGSPEAGRGNDVWQGRKQVGGQHRYF